MKTDVVVIIVLYKTKLKDSKTYNTFLKNVAFLSCDYTLIIYNNSIDILIPESKNYRLVNAKTNEKLSGSYNYALSYSNECNAKWLLLLDQDTEITSEYFTEISKFVINNEGEKEIVAVVPCLKDNGRHISPHKLCFFKNAVKKINVSDKYNSHVIALNSLSLLSVEFLNKIGGFSLNYPLDMLDYWVYTEIHKNKKAVFLLNTVVQHNLSVMDFEKNMSISRYKDLLEAERKIMSELGRPSLIVYYFRLFFRSVKQYLKFNDKIIALVTFKNIFSNK